MTMTTSPTEDGTRLADARRFRTALGTFPTGVALITATTPDGPVGMIVNSFSSVSLDPMLVSYYPAKTSSSWARLASQRTCAISILGAEQEELSRRFASRAADRFAGAEWTFTEGGHPIPRGAAAWFDVEVAHVDAVHAGDHDLVICRVKEWSHSAEVQSLLFHGGRYGVPLLPELVAAG